jgi:hypothetical protein
MSFEPDDCRADTRQGVGVWSITRLHDLNPASAGSSAFRIDPYNDGDVYELEDNKHGPKGSNGSSTHRTHGGFGRRNLKNELLDFRAVGKKDFHPVSHSATTVL